jgi:hypothetical protein
VKIDEQVIALLTEIRDTQAASALCLLEIRNELARPRLEAEHLRIQTNVHIAESERERQRVAKHAELEQARMPTLRVGGAGAGLYIREVAAPAQLFGAELESPPESDRLPP